MYTPSLSSTLGPGNEVRVRHGCSNRLITGTVSKRLLASNVNLALYNYRFRARAASAQIAHVRRRYLINIFITVFVTSFDRL